MTKYIAIKGPRRSGKTLLAASLAKMLSRTESTLIITYNKNLADYIMKEYYVQAMSIENFYKKYLYDGFKINNIIFDTYFEDDKMYLEEKYKYPKFDKVIEIKVEN